MERSKRTLIRKAAEFIVFLFLGMHAAAAEQAWTIDSVSLSANETAPHEHELSITVQRGPTGLPVKVVSDTPLTALTTSFIYRDRLVVIGRADRISATMIFDLPAGKKSDWFYCILPARIFPSWIAYVEIYPPRATSDFNDVVLVYDLARSPEQNRLAVVGGVPVSSPRSGSLGRIEVGNPVFPSENAEGRSYRNQATSLADINSVLPSAPFTMVGGSLVFVAVKGQYPEPTHDYIAVVDLTHGLQQSIPRAIDIPRQSFTRPGPRPDFIDVTGIQVEGTDTVVLSVPAGEYGVSNVRVSLTGKPVAGPISSTDGKLDIPPGAKYVEIGEAAEAANLLSVLPPLTWTGATTVVRFSALIGPDGSVAELSPTSGPTELIPQAQRIVAGLVYRPTFLNGKKMSVLTTIAIEYKHSQ